MAERARIRQVVVAAWDCDETARHLRSELDLGPPFTDPGVAAFGLRNAVMALGDCFVEVVAPVTPDAPARRFLERQGPGGYMVIFQVPDLAAAEARVAALGIRAVWRSVQPDIGAIHLHPADVGAAIVSLDQPRPPESWRWAGPEWTGGAPEHDGRRVTGVVLSAPDPPAVAARWAAFLDAPADGAEVALAGGRVVVEPGAEARFIAFEVGSRRVSLGG